MNFTQICERSGLDQEAIRFYVNEKLITPLFPENLSAEDAEYAEEDLLRLDAIANLRRLRFSSEDVRKILHDPSKAAALSLHHFAALSKKQNELSQSLQVMEELDLASLNNPEDVLENLAALDLKEISLPRRDLNRDDEARIRAVMDEKSTQNQTMHEQMLSLEKSNHKLLIFSLVCLFFFVLCLGFILGPYIFW